MIDSFAKYLFKSNKKIVKKQQIQGTIITSYIKVQDQVKKDKANWEEKKYEKESFLTFTFWMNYFL